MSRLLVAYFSRTGRTQEMAEEIGRGARETGVAVDVLPLQKVAVDALSGYQGIVIGSPSYYGTMVAEAKHLLDSSIKLHGKLVGKVGGAFATAASVGGGSETAVLSILQALMVHGMIITGMATDDHYGPTGIHAPDAERLIRTCRAYGKAVAELTKKLHG
ncbi:flavodoxin family protein [bacterium]|nr:flavodoxin family protein [bacterium]